jgi:hypothetical protein
MISATSSGKAVEANESNDMSHSGRDNDSMQATQPSMMHAELPAPSPTHMRSTSLDSQRSFTGSERTVHVPDTRMVPEKAAVDPFMLQVPEFVFVEDKPDGYYERYPNFWSKIRCVHCLPVGILLGLTMPSCHIREPAAEALGTMMLCLVGISINCQVSLSADPAIAPGQVGVYLSQCIGWAFALALGVWISAGISGGHCNPVVCHAASFVLSQLSVDWQVTVAMAIFRGFPWRKVPVYIFAQVFGAFIGALIVYSNYFHAIDIFEGGAGVRTVPGTASFFSPYVVRASSFRSPT